MRNPNVKVRKATEEDAKGIYNVVMPIVREGKDTAMREFTMEEGLELLRSLYGREAIFVAELEGEIVGVQVFYMPYRFWPNKSDHVAEIGTYVHVDHRRRGVGTELVEGTLNFAGPNGYTIVQAMVLASNKIALCFYESLGFREVARRSGHVNMGDMFEDEVIMELKLA